METFEEWYASADRICIGIAGVGIEDLPDGPSWDAWNDGVRARHYVLDQLEADGFPMDLLS